MTAMENMSKIGDILGLLTAGIWSMAIVRFISFSHFRQCQ